MKKITSLFFGLLFLFSASLSFAGEVQLYHDKAGWQDWWIETFELDTNNTYEITPFADTSSFQATVRQSLRADPRFHPKGNLPQTLASMLCPLEMQCPETFLGLPVRA